MTSDEELMAQARKRAEDKVGFYVHFGIYVVINSMFALAWWFTGAGFPWFIFPLGFWGIGLVAHFVSVFAGTGISDRMAQREYERLKQEKGW